MTEILRVLSGVGFMHLCS